MQLDPAAAGEAFLSPRFGYEAVAAREERARRP